MSNMTIQDKREFLRENVKNVVLFDRTEDSYVAAMYELYHIAKDQRFPMFIRNAISVVFAQIEDGNFGTDIQIQELKQDIARLESDVRHTAQSGD